MLRHFKPGDRVLRGYRLGRSCRVRGDAMRARPIVSGRTAVRYRAVIAQFIWDGLCGAEAPGEGCSQAKRCWCMARRERSASPRSNAQRRSGATVVATASTEEKLALARSHGADHTVDFSIRDCLGRRSRVAAEWCRRGVRSDRRRCVRFVVAVCRQQRADFGDWICRRPRPANSRQYHPGEGRVGAWLQLRQLQRLEPRYQPAQVRMATKCAT